MTTSGGRRAITKDEVARGAGVTVQAVSNWIRRHPDFPRPQPRRDDARDVWSASAVAAWLDHRVVPAPALLPDERPGTTYGARFRGAVRLQSAPEVGPVSDTPDDTLWASLERLLRHSRDPRMFEAVVLALLCLGATDPASWPVLARATPSTMPDVIAQVSGRQPERIAKATSVVGQVVGEPWWPRQLVTIIGILGRPRGAQTFTHLLDRFARYRHRSADEYLLPVELAELMVEMVDPTPRDRIHDPCSGVADLLVAAVRHVARTSGGRAPAAVTGRAATNPSWDLATMNTAVHGTPVDLGDGPSESPWATGAGPVDRDVVVLNPPFGRRSWDRPTSPAGHAWRYGEPSPHNVTFAWVQTALGMLAPGGRAALVLPPSSTFDRTSRERRIRAAMVEDGAVRCVLALPGQLFRETSIAVMVWILTRPSGDEPHDVLMIDGRSAAVRDGATHRVLTKRGCRGIVDRYREWIGGRSSFPALADGVTATVASLADIRENDYDLQPELYVGPRCRAAARAREQVRLRDLPRELADLDASARAADAALEQRLKELTPWTR